MCVCVCVCRNVYLYALYHEHCSSGLTSVPPTAVQAPPSPSLVLSMSMLTFRQQFIQHSWYYLDEILILFMLF